MTQRLHSNRSRRGFTLVELMVVVALVASVTGMGVWTLSGSLRVQQTADLARGISFALMRARGEAVTDGFQRRITCTANRCALEVASAAGMAAPASWSAGGWSITTGSQSMVWAIDGNTDVAATDPGVGPLSAARSITFFPDGTASAATVFLRDARGQRLFKVFVYRASGMARIVDRW